MNVAIQIQELTCRFGATVAVADLSLEVRRGEVFALLGHNGAGKTTTVRTLNGLLEPASGAVRVLGLDPLREGPVLRRRTAVLPETSTVDERLTAWETLQLFGDLFGVPPAEVEGRARGLLARFGLLERAGDRAATYSKGMKQRLSLARALLHEPELLYLDEPAAGLDPAATLELHGLIRQLSREQGRTVVLCTHNLVEAQELADRVAVLARGRLVALGTPSELVRQIAPSREVTIEVAPADTVAAARLLAEEPGLDVHADGDGVLTVSGAARDRLPALSLRLASAGIGLYRLVPREPSLADVYFAVQASLGPEAEATAEGSR